MAPPTKKRKKKHHQKQLPTVAEPVAKVAAKAKDNTTNIFEAVADYDQNGDKVITRDELFTRLKMLNAIYWSETEIQKLLDSLDMNKDGKLQYEEFIIWISTGEATKGIWNSSVPDAETGNSSKSINSESDTFPENSSGLDADTDPSTPRANVAKEESKNMNDAMHYYDVDRDNVITEDELYKGLKKVDPVRFTYDRMKQLLKRLDIDGNGELEYDEFARWLTRRWQKHQKTTGMNANDAHNWTVHKSTKKINDATDILSKATDVLDNAMNRADESATVNDPWNLLVTVKDALP